MKRDELLKMVKRNGWERGKKASFSTLEKMRQELEAYFDTEEGKYALSRAPRCMLYTSEAVGDSSDVGMEMRAFETTKELAVRLILSEFGGEAGGEK